MIFTVDNVLTAEELGAIAQNIKLDDFIDGKKTAGWHAQLVKHNTQLDKKTPYISDLYQLIRRALKRNALFQAAVQPRTVHSILFSRYEAGMSYGTHVDNALMGDDRSLRSDVSFTLFLSSPEEYDGGELVIEASDGDRTFKLSTNSMIVYPSSYLHRVEAITAGVRFVAVGWVQSLVREPAKREILFDLDTVKRSIFAQQGKSIEFDLLSKTHANLLRSWMD